MHQPGDLGLLIAGSIIGSIIFMGSGHSSQPDWFAWFIRVFIVVFLLSLWFCSIRELYRRKKRHPHQIRDDKKN